MSPASQQSCSEERLCHQPVSRAVQRSGCASAVLASDWMTRFTAETADSPPLTASSTSPIPTQQPPSQLHLTMQVDAFQELVAQHTIQLSLV